MRSPTYFQLGCAADPADEVDSFARPRVVDAENWRERVFLQQGHVQLFDRMRRGRQLRAKTEGAPLVAQEKAEFMLTGGLRRAGLLDDEHGFEFPEQRFRRKAVQILEHAVVGEDLHLVVREQDRQKVRALPGAFA